MHIRRTHHLFPVRPYLSLLVEALEDSDANVRDTARASIVELFTGPGVTDAARADLKKEMTKKGVGEGIVDGVLVKVIGGTSTPGSEGSENGDSGSGASKKDYVPPSLMLKVRRPTTGSEGAPGPSGMSRTVSQGSVSQLARPASRAAVPSPPPGSDAATDVQPVYVSVSITRSTEYQ